MRNAKLIRLGLVLFLLMLLLTIACNDGGDSSGHPSATKPTTAVSDDRATKSKTETTTLTALPKTLTIVDSMQRTVKIPYPLKRIALLAGTVGEIIRALGETDRIVGITQDMASKTEYWAELQDKPVCGSISQPNYEKIAELDPDVVIVFGPWNWNPELEQKLSAAGITVVALECFQPATLAQDVMIVGEMLGREKEADAFVTFFRSYLNAVKEGLDRIPANERKQVYHEWGHDYSSSGPGSSWDEAIAMAGGVNIFADSDMAYPTVSPEAVLMRNPQVVIKTLFSGKNGGYPAADAKELTKVHKTLLSRTGWQNLDAVKNEQVYVISSALGYGAMRVVSICYLAKIFYPERFTDLDPQAMLREYLERFQGQHRTRLGSESLQQVFR